MVSADSSSVSRRPAKKSAKGPLSTSANSVYDRIRADILSLSLVPASDLDEKTLAEQYGVSRTPIREALIRLSGDGLIEFSPTRGARVTPLILPNFPRYLESLDLLQRGLVRIGAVRISRNDERKLNTALSRFGKEARRIDIARYRSVEQASAAEAATLHAIGKCAHNAYLFDAFEKLLVQGQRMLRLPLAYNPSGDVPVEDYAEVRIAALRAVADAFAIEDGEAAEAAMREFHGALKRRLIAYASENLAADVAIEPTESE